MNLGGLQQGDLAKWLRIVAEAQDASQAADAQIPAVFIERLLLLRCIERGVNGALRITEIDETLAGPFEEPVRHGD